MKRYSLHPHSHCTIQKITPFDPSKQSEMVEFIKQNVSSFFEVEKMDTRSSNEIFLFMKSVDQAFQLIKDLNGKVFNNKALRVTFAAFKDKELYQDPEFQRNLETFVQSHYNEQDNTLHLNSIAGEQNGVKFDFSKNAFIYALLNSAAKLNNVSCC